MSGSVAEPDVRSGGSSSTEGRVAVRTALLALSDRTGAEALALALLERGATIYATTGTATYLRGLGLAVEPAERLTRSPEFLGGRVKTLSSDLFGAILARAGHAGDERDLAARDLPPIDLVCVTLYPFESLPRDASWEEAVEKIDVGGVALLRAAAKNFARVAVLSTPDQYPAMRDALAAGGTTLETRRALARAAFERTAEYDATIAGFFEERETGGGSGGGASAGSSAGSSAGGASTGLPEIWVRGYRRARGLRYGENPHQEAALYAETGRPPWWSREAVLEGKELSFNNLVDLEAGARLVYEFARPACAIIKHNEPSGVGLSDGSDGPLAAYKRAAAGDPLSAFGGVVAFNIEVDGETAQAMAPLFLECVAAPAFTASAREEFAKRKNLRAVVIGRDALAAGPWDTRPLARGLLVQRVRPDTGEIQLEVKTKRAPTPAEMEALHFAWIVSGRARSNAVVISRADGTLGVGSGQTSRIDALHVALMKAARAGHDVRGAVIASDGFFPFGDWVAVAREAGLTACIQPGGSVRDVESIAACDDAGIAMVFTGRRQFRH